MLFSYTILKIWSRLLRFGWYYAIEINANKMKRCQANKYVSSSLHFSVIDYDLRHLWRSSFIRPDPEANSMERIAKFSSWTTSATEGFIGFRSRRVRLVCHPSEAPSFPSVLCSHRLSWDNSIRIVGHARIARKIGPSAEVGRTEEKKTKKKTRNETEARFLDLRSRRRFSRIERKQLSAISAKLKEQAGCFLRGRWGDENGG